MGQHRFYTIFHARFLLVMLFSLLLLPRYAAAKSAESQARSDSGTFVFACSEAMCARDMSAARGAGSPLVSSQTLAASTSGQSIITQGDFSSGMIRAGDHFGGAGLGSYVANTGNLTAINSAVAINIYVTGYAP